jgi:isopenicillin N synthase-like dioxygenase
MLSQPNPYDSVDTANLYTVVFKNLFDKDSKELETLLKACERDGFFYLDLQNSSSAKLWRDLERVSEIAKHWFSQPVEVKLKTPTVSLAHGFVHHAGWRITSTDGVIQLDSRLLVINPGQ